jgi:hypothetical protein
MELMFPLATMVIGLVVANGDGMLVLTGWYCNALWG